jgi:ferrous iron transport protein A
MSQLNELQVGERATVTGYTSNGMGYRRKLQALGLRPGTRIGILRRAATGVPLALQVRGITILLHPEEAAALAVEKSPTISSLTKETP